jgi:hypothetical protein
MLWYSIQRLVRICSQIASQHPDVWTNHFILRKRDSQCFGRRRIALVQDMPLLTCEAPYFFRVCRVLDFLPDKDFEVSRSKDSLVLDFAFCMAQTSKRRCVAFLCVPGSDLRNVDLT